MYKKASTPLPAAVPTLVIPVAVKRSDTVVTEAAPAAMVTSTSPSVACSPSNTRPAVSVVVVPSLSATINDNLPASSVLSASDTSARIFAKVV